MKTTLFYLYNSKILMSLKNLKEEIIMARVKKVTTTEELAPELTPAVDLVEMDVMATAEVVPEEIEENIKESAPVEKENKVKTTEVKSTKKITTKVQSLNDFLY